MTSMNDNVSTIKGIGPKKTELLKKMGITKISDLIYYFPRTYQDKRKITGIKDLTVGETCQIKGRVIFVASDKFNRTKKQNLRLLVEDSTGKVEIVFFNAQFLVKQIKRGDELLIYGKVTSSNGKTQFLHPEIEKIDGDTSELGIVPVYPITKGISQNEIRKLIRRILGEHIEFEDYIPKKIIEKNKLCPIDFAINNIHKPETVEHLKIAKYRLIFEELFIMQLGLLMMKRGEVKGVLFNGDTKEYTDKLPFELTDDQKKVLLEIKKDTSSGKSMNRLLQGDVGSGKTAVAEAALYLTVISGYQGAFMAPTDLLARQHYAGLKTMFDQFGINVGLLSGSMKAKEKREVLNKLKNGDINIIVGTNAIIQEKVDFNKLGLVITDEQHRFGVNQRLKLYEKGDNPHVLIMTATPIPRTLAIILYGDLDISIIKSLPKGRKKIITEKYSDKKRNYVYNKVLGEIKSGKQCYVVAPLIEESENISAKSATNIYEELQSKFINENVSIELIHGDIKQDKRDEIMAKFKSGEIHILVSTVVIEVGINVPNATVMVIENSERFGLAQMHQLRGRVGRGSLQSYCYLICNSESDVAQARAKIMTESTDGFYISEQDLKLRGPGEMFGVRQHGIPDMRLADLIRHTDILQKVRDEIKSEYNEVNDNLKARVISIFGEKININI
ncbi:MAG: ATP-dependent DNA helicase RecG [Anaerovoracaceae bacterium]